MKIKLRKFLFFSTILLSLGVASVSLAQGVNLNANQLLPRFNISLSPRSGSFVEGSTFEVPIIINTNNRSINGIEVKINYNKDKLAIVKPTGGTSIIGVWVEPPVFDNTRGLASYVGVIPNGITTNAGLVGTITFMAKSPGKALVYVNSDSKVLINDGLGSEGVVDFGTAEYTILPKPPEGVQIFSDTHPVQSSWYNNNTPVLSWIKDPGVSGFSFVLDNEPNTIPDNIIDGEENSKTFESLVDGLWYFHIKANKGGSWSSTGHFLVRIDTTPPADFKPQADFLAASIIATDRTLVSFFTTDNLSGVDHYEVGVIDKNQPATVSPIFIQAESPYQVPISLDAKLEVIVRAVDKAGNVRDASIDVRTPLALKKFFQNYPIYILVSVIMLGATLFILHLLFGHHIVGRIRRVVDFIKNDKTNE